MSITDKDARQRWEESKEQELWDFMQRLVGDGWSITAALKEYGRKSGMSWLTARWKYYQLKGKKPGGDSPSMAPNRAVSVSGRRHAISKGPSGGVEGVQGNEFLGYLTDLVEGSSKSGEDIVPLIKGLSRLAILSSEGQKLRASQKEREQAVADARVDVEKARAAQAVADQALERLCSFLEGWLALPPVEKVGMLKEFEEKLRDEVDMVLTR